MLDRRALFATSEVLLYTLAYYLCFWWVGDYEGQWLRLLSSAVLVVYPVISNGFQKKRGAPTSLAGLKIVGPIVGVMILIDPVLGAFGPFPGARLTIGSIAVNANAAFFLPMYFVFALFQQYILMGFLLERLTVALHKEWLAGAGTFALYVLAHFPNPPLVLSAVVGGVFFFGLYFKFRNILPAALLHAAAGAWLYKLFVHADISFQIGRAF